MAEANWLVLTSANDAQTRGYEAQLRAREEAGLLQGVERWKVVADPGGRRVGSGGSTLWVFYTIGCELAKANPKATSIEALFERQRIITIHSGGDSRRLCAYAAQGKVFCPLPCDVPGHDQPAALFDLIASDLLKLPAPSRGQALFAAGDVLLTFYRKEVDFSQPGIVGVAYPGPIERGSKHGVYVADDKGDVSDFLQKPDEQEANERGAIDAVGRVLIDTGLISLDPPTIARWLEMAGAKLSGGKLKLGDGLLRAVKQGKAGAIDLYEQMLMAVPKARDRKAYLEAMAGSHTKQGLDAATKKRLMHIHRALHGQPFHVNVLPYCEFFHVGSGRDLLSNIGGLNRTAQVYSFENFDRSVVPDRAVVEGAFVYNSVIEAKAARIGAGAVVEACHVRSKRVELEGRNIVVGWPGEATADLVLPEGIGLVCLPVDGSGDAHWSVVVFGIEDDFKTARHDGGTFLNEPMEALFERSGLNATQVFGRTPHDRQTLWEAKLWPTGPIDQVLELVLWMMRDQQPDAKLLKHFVDRKRLSMAELLGRVQHDRLIAHRDNVQRLGDLYGLADRLSSEAGQRIPAASIIATLRDVDEAKTAMKHVDAAMSATDDPLRHARLYKLAEAIAEAFPKAKRSGPKVERGDYEKAAFDAVASAVSREIDRPREPRPAAILPDQVVWATTPVRIDFAGGWSDTPPICTEMGGTVVNAAITLNGQYPVQVMAKLNPEHRAVTLSSIDLGQRQVIERTEQVLAFRDPTDWAALPKAALVLAGIAPSDHDMKLKDWLEVLGGGLDITIFSALPKGSGLGTSSVLGAAMLACLDRVHGVAMQPDHQRLFAHTSLLEQLMTTGGGWQDQVGGITRGIKIIRTRPGPEQEANIHWTGADLSSDGPFRDRLLLYFTGQKRMARNILQQVVGRYLARDPKTIDTIHRLKRGAEAMKDALDRGDLDAIAAGIEDYWSLKKGIDPGSTNPKIEALLKPLDRHLVARLLPGAGGGGFVFMITRSRNATEKVRQTLEKHPPNEHARFFDFDVDAQGLKVTVL